MDNSICKIIPRKKYEKNIRILSFVYETNHKRLQQPECHSTYRLCIVTNGTATIKYDEKEFLLNPGTVYLMFPNTFYEIRGNDNFRYAYINFSGKEVGNILEDLAIMKENSVYHNFDELLDFWLTSFSKINPANSATLTEGVLLYTLSLLNTRNILAKPTPDDKNLYHMITDYIDNNFSMTALSLTTVANMFSYSEKYISHIFKKNNTVGFSAYIQELRVKRAIELMQEDNFSVKGISGLCGFSDPFYFSKVFKKKTGLSPKEYRAKLLHANNEEDL